MAERPRSTYLERRDASADLRRSWHTFKKLRLTWRFGAWLLLPALLAAGMGHFLVDRADTLPSSTGASFGTPADGAEVDVGFPRESVPHVAPMAQSGWVEPAASTNWRPRRLDLDLPTPRDARAHEPISARPPPR